MKTGIHLGRHGVAAMASLIALVCAACGGSPDEPSAAGDRSAESAVGANNPGPYDSTSDGSPSMNGNGIGLAIGRPCAGCVGNADDKNPPGQLPGPEDLNAGYECDTNSGIGKTNPAHSGCSAAGAGGSPDAGEGGAAGCGGMAETGGSAGAGGYQY